METGNAILTIAGQAGDDVAELTFEISSEISDGYRNRLKVPAAESSIVTNPKGYRFLGGGFKPINVTLDLAVGVQSTLTTADELKEVVKTLFRMALMKESTKGSIHETSTLSIGNWFVRPGYIEDLNVTWHRPYDIETGMSLRATVTFAFITDFYGPEKVSEDRNPKNTDFEFDFTGNRSTGSGS